MPIVLQYLLWYENEHRIKAYFWFLTNRSSLSGTFLKPVGVLITKVAQALAGGKHWADVASNAKEITEKEFMDITQQTI